MTQGFAPEQMEPEATDPAAPSGDRDGRTSPWVWVALVLLIVLILWLLWQFFGHAAWRTSKVVVSTSKTTVGAVVVRVPTFPDTTNRSANSGPTVPDVVGMPRSSAVSAVQGAGYAASVVAVYGTTHPDGTIIQQNPSGGSRLGAGGTVGMLVQYRSKGATAPMPRLIGMTQSAAEQRLATLGITPTISYSPQQTSGRVFSQWPLPGDPVVIGGDAQIQITVVP